MFGGISGQHLMLERKLSEKASCSCTKTRAATKDI